MSKSSKKKSQNHDNDDKMAVDTSSASPGASTSQKPDISSNDTSTHVRADSSDCADDHDGCVTTTIKRDDLIKIVCISDTHNGHEVPKFAQKIRQMQGDILIHAGDFGENGSDDEVESAFKWLCSLDNFKFKIFISGNMDGIGLQKHKFGNAEQKRQKLFSNNKNVIYLENDDCKVLGIKIYGCPYTPKFVGGFQYHRQSEEAKRLWAKIPKDCDILVSHGPPVDILDKSSRGMIL
jgi:Icc-related predicted phosphoesterase